MSLCRAVGDGRGRRRMTQVSALGGTRKMNAVVVELLAQEEGLAGPDPTASLGFFRRSGIQQVSLAY